MSDFKAKMHQIRFPQAPPQTPLDEPTALRALPRPLADFRGLLRTERRGESGEREGRGEESWNRAAD